ncbi:uncharacterized protein V1518DRAFT_409057 [Limtongia smithiae]|uniref:uncharacterized protein n=1 Tax=Limtongia smithiae TaxID=1125753 RepID=UPI0034CE8A15
MKFGILKRPVLIFLLALLLPSKMSIGRIIHYSVDLVLVSAVLAGVKRSTGLAFKTDSIESTDVRSAVTKYLDVGEWVLDTSVAFMNSSPYFIRKR